MREADDVPQDTDFYKDLEKFRSERAKNNLLSDKAVANLVIPGKIVHLIDTKGDNSDYKAYVPYWANCYQDFNQIIISRRMKSDHSMIELVDILRDVSLSFGVAKASSVTSSTTFYNSVKMTGGVEEEEIEEEDHDFRFFMFFSNPDGKIPILLSLVTICSLALSWSSFATCNFFSRKSSLVHNETSVIDYPFSIGLFSYSLLTCSGGECGNFNDTSDITPSDYCVPFPDDADGDEPDQYRMAAEVFAFLVVLFGGTGFLILCVSTCLALRRRVWVLITCLLLSSALFQGLVFIMNQSAWCNDIDIPELYLTLVSSCHLGVGGVQAILACCLYFLASLGAIRFAKIKSG